MRVPCLEITAVACEEASDGPLDELDQDLKWCSLAVLFEASRARSVTVPAGDGPFGSEPLRRDGPLAQRARESRDIGNEVFKSVQHRSDANMRVGCQNVELGDD